MNDLCCFVEVGFRLAGLANGDPVNRERSPQALSQFLILIMHCHYNTIEWTNEWMNALISDASLIEGIQWVQLYYRLFVIKSFICKWHAHLWPLATSRYSLSLWCCVDDDVDDDVECFRWEGVSGLLLWRGWLCVQRLAVWRLPGLSRRLRWVAAQLW